MAVQPILKIKMVKFVDVLKKTTNKTAITKQKQQQQQNTLSQIKKGVKRHSFGKAFSYVRLF